MSNKLIGTDPNQTPRNADLGTMAYQDADSPVVSRITVNNIDSEDIPILSATINGVKNATMRSVSGGSAMAIGTGNTAIIFNPAANGGMAIYPWDATNNVGQNETIDLGYGTRQWRDIYLGGGLIFDAKTVNGSTIIGNKLDDYELGTWTPWISFGSPSAGTAGQTYSWQYGKYVKIGNLVTLWFSVGNSNIGTDTGNAYIRGLPFKPASTSFNFNYFDVTGYSLPSTGWDNQVYVELNSGYNGYGTIRYGTRGSASSMTNSNFQNGFRLTGNFTFAV
jgi:hypothetical protein